MNIVEQKKLNKSFAASLRVLADDIDKRRKVDVVTYDFHRDAIDDPHAPHDGCQHFMASPFTYCSFTLLAKAPKKRKGP